MLIPGVVLGGGQDVGGSGGQTAFPDLGIHGSKSSDSVETMGGMSISVLSTGTHQPVQNPAGTQEVVLDTASGDAEHTVGGVRIHRIPREGGNTLNATFFGAFANGDMQGSNLTDEPVIGLRTRFNQDQLRGERRLRRANQARQAVVLFRGQTAALVDARPDCSGTRT